MADLNTDVRYIKGIGEQRAKALGKLGIATLRDLTSAVFNFLGVLIMTHINSSVASTISNMVDFGGNTHEALIALCAALFSIVVYSVGRPASASPPVRATA